MEEKIALILVIAVALVAAIGLFFVTMQPAEMPLVVPVIEAPVMKAPMPSSGPSVQTNVGASFEIAPGPAPVKGPSKTVTAMASFEIVPRGGR